MYISSVSLNNFRNYKSLILPLEPGGAIFIGPNGEGKTNLLEAIYLLSTGRSQRKAKRKEMVFNGFTDSRIEGTFFQKDHFLKHTISLYFSKESEFCFKINGNKNRPFSEWFGVSKIVSFGPEDIWLILGGPTGRRSFLDVLISQMDKLYLGNLIKYKKNILNRNKVLCKEKNEIDLDVYEERIAYFGAYIISKRYELIEKYGNFFSEFYLEMSKNREEGRLLYFSNVKNVGLDVDENIDILKKQLRRNRMNDKRYGFTAYGPHRDDMKYLLDGHEAQSFASHGQCMSLAISTRLFSIKCIEKEICEDIIILVDDAFSGMDEERIEYVFGLLGGKGQLFITSRCGDIPYLSNLKRYKICQGKIEQL